MQTFIHYFFHLVIPLLIALVFFRKEWKKVYLLLLLTMLVDLDHLFASPVFQANRCSIGYHPLHSYYAIAGYAVLLFVRRPFSILGLGLLFHMLTDLIDCLWMFQNCPDCYVNAPAYELMRAVAEFLGFSFGG